MPTSTPNQTATSRREDHLWMVFMVFLCSVTFASGYATCSLLTEKRIWREADRRARDFLAAAFSQGILVVNHERIAELQRQMSEGQPVSVSSDDTTNEAAFAE